MAPSPQQRSAFALSSYVRSAAILTDERFLHFQLRRDNSTPRRAQRFGPRVGHPVQFSLPRCLSVLTNARYVTCSLFVSIQWSSCPRCTQSRMAWGLPPLSRNLSRLITCICGEASYPSVTEVHPLVVNRRARYCGFAPKRRNVQA